METGGVIKEEDDIANEVIKAFAGNLATKTGSDTIVIILYTPSPKAPDQFMPRFSLYERNQQEHWVRQVKSKK